MKLISMVIGFLVFSLVATMMFATTHDIMNNNGNVAGTEEFQTLAGDYDDLTGAFGDSSGTARQIENLSKSGAAQATEPDVSAFKGALAGGKMSVNFLTNFQNIINTVSGDVGAGYVDQRIINGILAIIGIFLIFVVVQFIRAFKMET